MCKKRLNDNKLIQRVLSFEKEGIFEMDDENTYIDFMDYLDDESVAWMDENYDATPQTIMLESIRDIIRGDRNNVLCIRRKQRKGCPS